MPLYKYLVILIIILLPTISHGQSKLANRYVDDRMNDSTYLDLKNGTFTFRYMYDLINDRGKGNYTLSKDTIFLTYELTNKSIENNLISHVQHPDTLIIIDYKLFQIQNGLNLELTHPVRFDHKVPKSWHFRHQYILFGPYQAPRSRRYYMIDSSHAHWNKLRKTQKSISQ